jgi:hypothetical protein
MSLTVDAIVGSTGLELKSDPGVPYVYAGFGGAPAGYSLLTAGSAWALRCRCSLEAHTQAAQGLTSKTGLLSLRSPVSQGRLRAGRAPAAADSPADTLHAPGLSRRAVLRVGAPTVRRGVMARSADGDDNRELPVACPGAPARPRPCAQRRCCCSCARPRPPRALHAPHSHMAAPDCRWRLPCHARRGWRAHGLAGGA